MQQNRPPMNNMQPIGDMKMPMHDTVWRNDQVMVVFHSKLPLIEDGVLKKEPVLDDLNLPEQLKRINTFLFQKFREQGRDPIHLVFLGDNEKPAVGDRPVMRRFNVGTSPQLPSGVYLFDEGTNIEVSTEPFGPVVPGGRPPPRLGLSGSRRSHPTVCPTCVGCVS